MPPDEDTKRALEAEMRGVDLRLNPDTLWAFWGAALDVKVRVCLMIDMMAVCWSREDAKKKEPLHSCRLRQDSGV